MLCQKCSDALDKRTAWTPGIDMPEGAVKYDPQKHGVLSLGTKVFCSATGKLGYIQGAPKFVESYSDYNYPWKRDPLEVKESMYSVIYYKDLYLLPRTD